MICRRLVCWILGHRWTIHWTHRWNPSWLECERCQRRKDYCP